MEQPLADEEADRRDWNGDIPPHPRGTTATYIERLRGSRNTRLVTRSFSGLTEEQVRGELAAQYDIGGNYVLRIVFIKTFD